MEWLLDEYHTKVIALVDAHMGNGAAKWMHALPVSLLWLLGEYLGDGTVIGCLRWQGHRSWMNTVAGL